MVARGRGLAEPRFAPGGRRLAFVDATGNRTGITVVDLDGGPERTVTDDPPPTSAHPYGGGVFDWTPDGQALVYAGADGALWWQPARGGPARQVAPPGKVAAPSVSPDGRRVAYVLDTRDVAVASLDEGGPWPVRLSAGADFAMDPCWSPDGTTVAWHEWDVPAMPWDESRIVTAPVDGSAPPVLVAGGAGVSVQQPRYSATGHLGYLCDASGWLILWVDGRPVLDEPVEHGGPTWGPGQQSWAWSPDGTSVAITRNEGGFGSLVVVDLTTGAVRPLGRGVHGGLSWSGGAVAGVRGGARTPFAVVVYEDGVRREVAVGPAAGFEPVLQEPEAVCWAGVDAGGGVGSDVPGRLYRPTATVLGDPPPLIVWVHGGPTDQWPVRFIPRLAFWQERGWAVLVPDYRGSSGHGRAFLQALAGRWGELDTADVVAGLEAAVERGWGDRARLVVMGGSAGGFTVLNVLASRPDLCAAGVDLYGVTDLFDLEETTHRYERHYLRSIVGPLPEAADRYRQRSPVNQADNITAPLLILQGTEDEAVPPAQSRAIADRMRAQGRPVELHLYDGEGHGWSRPETVVDELARTESFLRRFVLRGGIPSAPRRSDARS